jgi:hypothetical protein
MVNRTLITMLLSLLTTTAHAEGLDELRAHVRQQVFHAVMQKLAQELALDDATAKRFAEASERAQVGVDAARLQLKSDYEALRDADRPDSDEATLERLSARVLEDQSAVTRALAERARLVHGVLSPRQFAHLVVIWPKVNRSVADLIAQAKAGEL